MSALWMLVTSELLNATARRSSTCAVNTHSAPQFCYSASRVVDNTEYYVDIAMVKY